MHPGDTIAAISSAVGPGARLIVRLSGPESLAALIRITRCTNAPCSGSASYETLHFADLASPGWTYCFHAPRSYTGEDAVEFHLPGNPLLAKLLLNELLSHEARLAEPGEFTARAFFSGRIDLAEAEGVAAVIAASNAAELQAARQLLNGELSRRVTPVLESIAETLALVEANLDFAEEDIAFVQEAQVRSSARLAHDDLARLVSESGRFETLSDEPRIVLLGRPNAGKSTLVNALVGQPRAVVSPIAGTTRDVLSAALDLPHGRVQLVDIAGVDPTMAESLSPGSAAHEIEQQSQLLAYQAIETASVLIEVRDGTCLAPPPTSGRTTNLTVWTKADLLDRPPTVSDDQLLVSAHAGTGLSELRTRLDRLAFGLSTATPRLALTGRHVAALTDAQVALARLLDAPLALPVELIAHELREALDALGRIRGHVTPDEILGRIFATFCIGK